MENARAEAELVLFTLVEDALHKTGLTPKDIDILVVNCSLFGPTPSLASMLVNHFKMRSDIQSYNLGGMGCSAGLISINLAKDLLQVRRNSTALVVSTENITQNFYLGMQVSSGREPSYPTLPFLSFLSFLSFLLLPFLPFQHERTRTRMRARMGSYPPASDASRPKASQHASSRMCIQSSDTAMTCPALPRSVLSPLPSSFVSCAFPFPFPFLVLFAHQKSMIIPNVLFRVGGAAVVLSNKRKDGWRAKYQLQHLVRTHRGADDAAYECVYQKEDPSGTVGVKLDKKLMAVAGEALKVNITTLGPLVLPLHEQLKFFLNLVSRKFLKMKKKVSGNTYEGEKEKERTFSHPPPTLLPPSSHPSHTHIHTHSHMRFS